MPARPASVPTGSYVQSAVHDEFAARFGARVTDLKVGNGIEDGVEIGPLINAASVAKVREHID